MSEGTVRSIEECAASIRALRTTIEALADPFRQAIDGLSKAMPDPKVSDEYWCLVAHADSLVRVRLFTEQNFNYIESIGLLGVTRYLFELVVWLKLMHQDTRYGLVYYHELLDKQRRYYADLRDHLERETRLLRAVGVEEDQAMRERVAAGAGVADQASAAAGVQETIGQVSRGIDGKVARAFTLYGDQARINGYALQAHLVAKEVLPNILESLSVAEAELFALKRAMSADVQSLVPKKWEWKRQSSLAGMEDEYNFIYTYTSRLLHATPPSVTTNKKNLEPDEVRVFLKYCHVRLLDVIEMATAALGTAQAPTGPE